MLHSFMSYRTSSSGHAQSL